MSKWQKGRKIGTNGNRTVMALTEVDKRRVNGFRELITNTPIPLTHHAIQQPQPLLRAWWLWPAHHHTYVQDGIHSLGQQHDDLPPFVRTSDPSPAHSASPPIQRSPHLHDRAIDAVPDQFPIGSLSLHGSLSAPP